MVYYRNLGIITKIRYVDGKTLQRRATKATRIITLHSYNISNEAYGRMLSNG